MEDVKELTREALDSGEKAESVLKDGFLLAMERIGIQFKTRQSLSCTPLSTD